MDDAIALRLDQSDTLNRGVENIDIL